MKYAGHEHAAHLMVAIKTHCEISSDWTGSAYCGLKIDWDYKNITLDLSMPGYINAALHKYQNPAPVREEHAPHTWNPPVYGAKTQYIEET
jgi:endonuclease I